LHLDGFRVFAAFRILLVWFHLPYVMKFNEEYTGKNARMIGVKSVDGMTQAEYRKSAIDKVRQLSIDVGIPQTLKKIGVKEAELDAIADVCTGGNPRPRTKELVLGVYKTIFGA